MCCKASNELNVSKLYAQHLEAGATCALWPLSCVLSLRAAFVVAAAISSTTASPSAGFPLHANVKCICSPTSIAFQQVLNRSTVKLQHEYYETAAGDGPSQRREVWHGSPPHGRAFVNSSPSTPLAFISSHNLHTGACLPGVDPAFFSSRVPAVYHFVF